MKNIRRHLLALALAFCLLAALGASALADNESVTVSATVGQPFSYSKTFDKAYTNMVPINPNGDLTVNALTDGFSITGTPTYAGNFLLRLTVTFADESTDVYDVNIQVLNADGSGPATPTPTPVYGGELKVTKHPTGETVEPGGTAKFIARAENATDIVWRLVSPDTTNTYTAQEAPAYFAGLYVEGLGSDTLTLHGIPYSLNNWCVEAKFIGAEKGQYLCSNGARITVVSAEPTTPRITNQPKSSQLQNGQTVTLSVTANTNSGSPRYQWYQNSENKNSGGTAIPGATKSSYTPPETPGVSYYYAQVWSVLDGSESTHVNSSVAAVQYPSTPANTQTPGTANTPNTANTGNADTSPNTSPNTDMSADAGAKAQSGADTGTGTTPETGANTVTGIASADSGSKSAARGEQAVVVTATPTSTRSAQRSHTGLILAIMALAAVLLAACVTLFFLKRSNSDD